MLNARITESPCYGLLHYFSLLCISLAKIMKRFLGISLLIASVGLLVFLYFRFRVAPDSAPYDMVLEDISGKNVVLPVGEIPVVLSLMQSWCGPCMAELNQWSDTLAQYPSLPFRVLAITDESPEIALKLSWRCQNNPGITLLRSRTPFREIDIHAFPTNYIFNEQGIVLHKQVGPLDLSDKEIRKILRLQK